MSQPFQRELEELAQAGGPGYRRNAIVALMLGIFPIIMSATVINVVIPDIQAWFHAGHLAAQVLASSFLASTAAAMLLSGGVIGRLGVRRTFFWLNLGFILSSLSVLASGGWFLWIVLVRIFQGVLAGIAQSLALIVIMGVFPAEQRGRATSIYGLGIVLSPTIGPVLGGALSTMFGWPAVFVFSLPFSLLSAFLAGRLLPRAAPNDLPRTLRALPALFLALFIGALSAAFLMWLKHPAAGWALAAASALGFALFLRDQARAGVQMLNFALLRHAGVAAACLVSFAYGAGLYGSTYLIPVYIRIVGARSPFDAGLVLLPGGVMLGFALAAGGVLADRLPPARVLLGGLLAFALSNAAFLLKLVPVDFGFVIACTLLGRIGLGLIIPSLNAGATRQAANQYSSTVSVLVNYFRQLGGTVGAGVVGLLLEFGHVAHGTGAAAFGQAFQAMAWCFVPAMLATWWMRQGRAPAAPSKPNIDAAP